MNRTEALKALFTTKIRATAHDFASLQVPATLADALRINPDSVAFDLKTMAPAINFEVTESSNTVKSEQLFLDRAGKRYPCWLTGDEHLVDNWLLSENCYPFYFQLFEGLGNAISNPKFVEFGTRSGYTGVVFAKAIKGKKTYVGIDPNLYVGDGLKAASATFAQLVAEGNDFSYFFIEGYSSSQAVQNSLTYSGPFDFIHIDGEHTYFGKLFDLWIAASQINRNGYILVDDFDHHKLVRDSIKVACNLGWFKAFSYVKTYRGLGILKI